MAKLLPKGTKGLAKLQNYNDVGEFVEKNNKREGGKQGGTTCKNLAGGTANPLLTGGYQ